LCEDDEGFFEQKIANSGIKALVVEINFQMQTGETTRYLDPNNASNPLARLSCQQITSCPPENPEQEFSVSTFL